MILSHPEFVARLVKPGADILSSLTAPTTDLWHAVTGIAGEAGEIFEVIRGRADMLPGAWEEQLIEELGDMEFYMQQTRANLSLQRSPYCDTVTELSLQSTWAARLVIASLKLLDRAKKVAVYNKAADVEAMALLMFDIDVAMAALRQSIAATREEVLEHNIGKLSKRYPGIAYSDQAAQARADKVGTVDDAA